MTEPTKAALYARVSTAAQGEEDKASIPTQVAKIEEYCQHKGYVIVDRYIDVGYSGAKKKRPAFHRMLTDTREGKFDVIVCWKADRLSRGMYPAAALMEVVEPLDIKLEAVEEMLDMNYFSLLAVVGKIELDGIRERTQFGREYRAKIKQLHPGGNRIDYGYTIRDGQIVVVEEEARWIRDLFSWVGSGKSARSWWKYANEHGFTCRNGGQGLTTQQISTWLRNPIYKGQYRWNKTTKRSGSRKKKTQDKHIYIPCEPIVSEELWDRVQKRLKLNHKYSTGNSKQFYLLRGLLKCGNCGKSFVGHSSDNRRYYQCYGTRNYPYRYQCRRPHPIKANILEQYVWSEVVDEIGTLVSEDDAIKHLLVEFSLNEALHREQEALDDCSRQRQLIATRERKGYLSPKEAELQYRAIIAEEEQHQEEIQKLEQMITDGGQMERVEELLTRADWLHKEYNWGWFESATNEAKRQLLEEIVDRVVITGSNHVEVRLKLPSPKLVESVASLSMHHTTCRTTRLYEGSR